jgi:nicotinamide-nucleotide amidase
MHAEVISIGDEMTSGQRLDTNSQWLSQQLADVGIRTAFHQTVGDDLAANVDVFRAAAQRADVVVASGGLGPTADDLTRQALADMLGVELVKDEAALAYIQSLFARRQRPMPERNVVQAMFPRGTRVIPNPHGTAPGIDADVPRLGRPPARFFCLPGVPAEMKEMFAATVAPALLAMLDSDARPIFHRVIRCFGVGESDLEAMLPDLIMRGRDPIVGITVSQATISLRISCAARNRAEADAKMQPTVDVITSCLGKLVFGAGEEELQHAVVRLLRERNQTLATLECGTGGRLADWLSEADPNGGCFRGGQVIRLQADDDTSLRAAAENVRHSLQTDFALAIGPFPAPQATGNAPGEVKLALASAGGTLARSVLFAGHPDIVKDLTAKRALNWLRLHLLGE